MKINNKFTLFCSTEDIRHWPFSYWYNKDVNQTAVIGFQIYVLVDTYNRIRKMNAERKVDDLIVLERHIVDTLVFSRVAKDLGLISEADLEFFEKLVLGVFLPDVIAAEEKYVFILLLLPPAEAHKRMIARGRSFEQSLSVDYLSLVQQKYCEVFDQLSNIIPTAIVEYVILSENDSVDIVCEKICHVIKKRLIMD